MKHVPILFSAAMIQANLREIKQPGTGKTNTRRVLKRPSWAAPMVDAEQDCDGIWGLPTKNGCWKALPIPQIGDRLWVRETWSDVNYEGAPGIAYRADGHIADLMDNPSFLEKDGSFDYSDPRLKFGKRKQTLDFATWAHDLLGGADGNWRPGIHMPRWVSRVTLLVTDVQIQRLQEITEADAIAEGAPVIPEDRWTTPSQPMCATEHSWKTITPLRWFRLIWDDLNAKRGFGWDQNPWVVSITYKPHLLNIDGPIANYASGSPVWMGIDYARQDEDPSALKGGA